MSILDKVQIGNSVQINLELSKDRLSNDVIEAVNTSSVATISDFRITDGKGIGVILRLSNGKEQWFFENEIDILDENGNIIEKENNSKELNYEKFKLFKDIKYENKNNFSDLLNPLNFMSWLIVSFRDIL